METDWGKVSNEAGVLTGNSEHHLRASTSVQWAAGETVSTDFKTPRRALGKSGVGVLVTSTGYVGTRTPPSLWSHAELHTSPDNTE